VVVGVGVAIVVAALLMWKRTSPAYLVAGRNTIALRTFRTLGHIELQLNLKGEGWFKPIAGSKLAGRRFQV
jgi:hypothetical protein